MSFSAWSRTAVARRFGIDTRALAAFRISFGLLLLADLLLRSRNIVAFYTDSGILSRTALAEQYPGLAKISIHALYGEAWAQVGLFFVAGVFAVLLAVGYRTTFSTLASWLLLVSLQARNPLVLNGGDTVFALLLFLAVFLPLGERWSVDALHRGKTDRRIASIASATLLLQVVAVYVVNILIKLQGDIWMSGDALRYVYNLEPLTTPLGSHMTQYPELLTVFSYLWLVLLATSALLILLTGYPRLLFTSAFIGGHLWMLLTMRIGLFPLISVVALLPFLPERVWDAVESRLPEQLLEHARWNDQLERYLYPGPPTPAIVRRWTRRTVPVVVGCLLILLLAWNAAAVDFVDPPDEVSSTVDPTEHRWDMFAPNPPQSDGWYVLPAELESGREVDALDRQIVGMERPPDLTQTYPTFRWRKYMSDLRRADDPEQTRELAKYLCYRVSDTHDEDATTITIIYVSEPTQFDSPEPTHSTELLTHSCTAEST